MASVSHCHGSLSGHLACSSESASHHRAFPPFGQAHLGDDFLIDGGTLAVRGPQMGSEANLSVRASAAAGDALIGGGPARIKREAGLVDINDQRSMIRGYRLAFARLTVDLGPDDARL